ncbi:MAG: type II toxin-antitoxin system HicB family antitoxin [Planctomycetes bacterium]|jgi:predicted RNase H-like HicB family nuclease|nr:type II toxin-antitoxin system HicB family antitoxin [Planctomycetota bacterium]
MRLGIRIIHEARGTYRSVCPSLPGCSSRGQTYEEAKVKIEEAIIGYLAALSNCVPPQIEEEVIEYYEEVAA